jgi:hypothetical protein
LQGRQRVVASAESPANQSVEIAVFSRRLLSDSEQAGIQNGVGLGKFLSLDQGADEHPLDVGLERATGSPVVEGVHVPIHGRVVPFQ